MRVAPGALAALLLAPFPLGGTGPAAAQEASSRLWRPADRMLITDLSRVSAVAVTSFTVYVATPFALGVFDRSFASLRRTIGTLEGYPAGPVLAMVADPTDDAAWLALPGAWAAYLPALERWDSGVLPGGADLVVLDRDDPWRGAYFRTPIGWLFVRRGALAAEAAREVPPLGRRIAPLSPAELLRREPGLEAVRLRVERDERLRLYRLTSAAATADRREVFLGTDGNGAFRVDLATLGVEQLPLGLLAAPSGAVALEGVTRADAGGGGGEGAGVSDAGGRARGRAGGSRAVDRVCAGADARFAGTRTGITCFRADLTHFVYVEGPWLGGLPGRIVRRLLFTSAALWAATDRGAVRVDRRTSAVRVLSQQDGLPGDDVYALAPASDGVWIGTSRGLAVARDSAAGAVVQVALTPGVPVLALGARGDTLWIGSSAGLLWLSPGAREAAFAAPEEPGLRLPILALALLGDTLLVATERDLAWRAGSAWHFGRPPGAPVGRVTALAPDRDGFWVAGTQGLAHYRPAAGGWTALTSPGDLPFPVNDVAADAESVWLATPVGVVRLARDVLVGR